MGPGESALSAIARLAERLEDNLQAYVTGCFLPWASAQAKDANGESFLAWLVCNDGDAFALSRPLLAIGSAHTETTNAVDEQWRSTVLVVDQAKSTPEAPALEILSLAGKEPKRLIFDILNNS